MTTPLRLGFLFSGLLHVAVAAAFSLSWRQDIPAVDASRPLTLNLALFKPAQAVPAQMVPQEEPEARVEPQTVEVPPPRPSEPEHGLTSRGEPRPATVVKQVAPKPTAKPRPVVKRVSRPKPVPKPRQTEKTPVAVSASEANPPAVARATAVKPQPVTAAALDPQEKQHYLAALAAKINRSKYYPTGSRRRGEEGRVVVRFVVQKDGALTDFNIVESSGSRRLDAAALKTLRRATPFRPIPDVLGRDQWSISVPIEFTLSG